MKRFLVGLFVVLFSLMLVGCSTDPVTKDLEGYSALNVKLDKQFNLMAMSRDMSVKMTKSQNSQDIAEILREFRVFVVALDQEMANFKPTTEEVRVPYAVVQAGVRDIIDGIDMAVKGAETDDQEVMLVGFEGIDRGSRGVVKGEAAIEKVAKAKGYEIQKN